MFSRTGIARLRIVCRILSRIESSFGKSKKQKKRGYSLRVEYFFAKCFEVELYLEWFEVELRFVALGKVKNRKKGGFRYSAEFRREGKGCLAEGKSRG